MLGWLPLLYVFPLCSEGRGEDRRRFKNAGETRSCFHRSLLFQSTDTSPKNSMKNYRIIFNFQLPYLAVHFYKLLSSRLYIKRFDVVSLSPLKRRVRTWRAITTRRKEKFDNGSFVQKKFENKMEAKPI